MSEDNIRDLQDLKVDDSQEPIYRLAPESDHHWHVRQFLTDRIKYSERKMCEFYHRWEQNERRMQAHIDLNVKEQELKEEQQDKSKAPAIVSIQLPYMYATASTVVTYLLHTFTGRRPLFSVGAYQGTTAETGQYHEQLLQYNADNARFVSKFHQALWDGVTYGVAAMRTGWLAKQEMRTVWTRPAQQGLGAHTDQGGGVRKSREPRLVYQGNTGDVIDPYLFFPDPRVPMSQVNRNGEYVFWRTFIGRHELKAMEARGEIRWSEDVPDLPKANDYDGHSSRTIRSEGDAIAGRDVSTDSWNMRNTVQIDQGTCWIVPSDLRLGDSNVPELWTFIIANKEQIVQAKPLGADHNMHPVAVTEPFGSLHSFGSLSLADYIAPIQDAMSWFINSHIYNVRSALNNMFVYDPSMVEEQDLKNPSPQKLIRLKKRAFGQDVRTIIQQLQVTDVTRAHIDDLETFGRLGDALSGANDNLRGQQDVGGRKTATEVRTSGQAAASRLAALARVISAQMVVDLTEQWSLNLQQYLTEEFAFMVLGPEGTTLTLGMDRFAGDFYYPVHDGTLPLDKVAMLDTWKEILFGVANDPELRQQFSLPRIFEYVAELGGARNIESFKVNVGPTPGMVPGANGVSVPPQPNPALGVLA